jgi:hypothetical protein
VNVQDWMAPLVWPLERVMASGIPMVEETAQWAGEKDECGGGLALL